MASQHRLPSWLRTPTGPWPFEVAAERSARHEGYAQSAVRAVLLLGLATVFVAGRAPAWCWALLLLGAAQVVLEVARERHFRAGTRSRNAVVRFVVSTAESAVGVRLLHATGALGAVACVAHLVAVAWVLPPGDPHLARLLGLVLAVLYLNSGVLGVLLDPPNFRADAGRVLAAVRALRTWAGPLLAVVLLLCLVVAPTPWPGVDRAVVAVVCLLTLAIPVQVGLHDRVLRAAETIARESVAAGRRRFFDDLHGQLSGHVKHLAHLVGEDDAVDPRLRELGSVLPVMVSGLAAAVDETAWRRSGNRVPLEEAVQGLSARHRVRTTLHLRAPAFGNDDQYLALLVLANLIPNAAAASHADAKRAGTHEPARLTVTVEHVGGQGVVQVQDGAPVVPEEFWAAPGTSLHRLRASLAERGGDLRQSPVPGGKVVTATWPVPPPRAAP